MGCHDYRITVQDVHQSGLQTIIKVQALFSQHFKEGKLDNWTPSFICDEAGMYIHEQQICSACCGYYTQGITLDKSINPTHMLAAVANEGFVHNNKNWVEYYKCIKDPKGLCSTLIS